MVSELSSRLSVTAAGQQRQTLAAVLPLPCWLCINLPTRMLMSPPVLLLCNRHHGCHVEGCELCRNNPNKASIWLHLPDQSSISVSGTSRQRVRHTALNMLTHKHCYATACGTQHDWWRQVGSNRACTAVDRTKQAACFWQATSPQLFVPQCATQ